MSPVQVVERWRAIRYPFAGAPFEPGPWRTTEVMAREDGYEHVVKGEWEGFTVSQVFGNAAMFS